MPADPQLMHQGYGMGVSRHLWTHPFVNFKLVRLYVEGAQDAARLGSHGQYQEREAGSPAVTKEANGTSFENKIFDIVAPLLPFRWSQGWLFELIA
jgi:hypothetical protein